MDDTGCFVLGRPYGRRGVLSLFEGGGRGGAPKVFSRKDPKNYKIGSNEECYKISSYADMNNVIIVFFLSGYV